MSLRLESPAGAGPAPPGPRTFHPQQEAVMGSVGHAAVLIAAALAGETDPAPAVDPADFRAWFDQAAAGRLRIPPAVEARARRLRYVLVGGFRSERAPGYFAQNIKELEARGVPAAAIHAIYPSSH